MFIRHWLQQLCRTFEGTKNVSICLEDMNVSKLCQRYELSVEDTSLARAAVRKFDSSLKNGPKMGIGATIYGEWEGSQSSVNLK